MRQIVVRYKAKPEMIEENARLIGKVFEELRATAPEGIGYLVLKLADGTFIHVSFAEGEVTTAPLTKLAAFQAFQSKIKDRTSEPPQQSDATIVGNYRMLSE